MNRSILVRIMGFRATLIHGDTLVLDRWRWLRRRLPKTANNESLLDVGCGTGAFTIGAALRGYQATGISWDERNQEVAKQRAMLCHAEKSSFVIGDVRELGELQNLKDNYDCVICLECVEHILNDLKLFRDLADRIKPGGRLLLSTPHYYYLPMSDEDLGPFLTEETGWHVRRGYTSAMLLELCETAGLHHGEISYCSGFISQMVTRFWRTCNRLPGGTALGFVLTLPLRLLPLILPDRWITQVLRWPFYSICLEAYKPRFENEKGNSRISDS
ncbi:class I SAM-dependent methyltransferase [Bythopirellula polymerisocia]|uniref:Ubiquinone biosynthesis O-methyltransferase n=1 Tax=Bythopirellula polymerisocia TaxID=2528003 RepID=A0A5C6CRP9_9BACT|nr:methyltransferase domain-containing protein [Bythopirellula polymerisocia]TWU25796.1 Ubiquinone biosynthesis O-methyltransferase [Bythopirellula polymerisocia]